MDSILLVILAVVLLVGVVMLVVVSRFGKAPARLDKSYFLKQWRVIETHKSSGNSGWQLAIFEADKLLDLALKQLNYGGQTMGERLKDAHGTFSNVESVWAAHKLRNRLAHEQRVPINGVVVDKALRSFKSALKDLGAL